MAELDPNDITEVQPFFETQVDVDDIELVPERERYEHVGRIGKGGMGEVRLVRDRKIARHIALKVLSPQLRRDRDYRARFLLEARLQGQLDHPAIVPVHDLGEGEDGALYFSMKCVRGVTLREALKQQSKYSRRRLLTAFSSMCLAIDFAHRRGVLHRDLKPRNIMLGDYGEVYVLDWGIAKLMADTPIREVLAVEVQDDVSMGTPRYMAPERARGQESIQTDVYSLGVILQDILDAEPAHPSPELEAIARGAHASDPAMRLPSARALHEAVERFLDGDRDLEARRKLAGEHAARAEQALAGGDASARSEAGLHLGRALGLDPSNAVALRLLMRVLVDVPATLPAPAEAEIRRRWLDRRARTLLVSTLSTLSMLLLIPMLIATGVRSWLLALFGAFVVGAAVVQYAGSRSHSGWPTAIACVLTFAALSVLETMVGLIGVVPAAFAVVTMAWRMNVERTLHGVMILLGAFAAITLPFVFRPPPDDMLVVVSGTFGAVAVALLYGRLYINELRRAEHRLSFQAWQLQQLLPPETPARHVVT